MAVTCPKCRFEQDGGEECLHCGIIFRKYTPLPPPKTPIVPTEPAAQEDEADYRPLRLQLAHDDPTPEPPENREEIEELEFERPHPQSRGLVKKAFRIVPWISLAAGIGAIVLIFQQAPPLIIQMDPRALERVDRKMEELHFAAQRGQSYTLTLDEAELNAWLDSSMSLTQGGQVRGLAPDLRVDDPQFQEAQSAMKDLKVKLTGDQLRAYAVFNFHGKNLSLLLGGRIIVENGYLRLKPTEGKIGSLPIPQATLDGVVQRLFESDQNRDVFQLSPQISTVDIRHGKLFVAYR